MHKVFISYYHKDDQHYKERFEELFGHLFINKSVEPGDIDTEVSTDYIKHLIQEDYISDISVLIVLVGPKTHCRKHIDWEISAALNKKVGGYSGLIGLCLPLHPDYSRNQYDLDNVPLRLHDNIKTGYAKFYNWTEDENEIQRRIEEAFRAREDNVDSIDNSREQMEYNTCE